MNNSNNCPKCGAKSCYHNIDLATKQPVWFGIGHDECCNCCGADYEHAYPGGRIPVTELSDECLQALACDVMQACYNNDFMTPEQITKNHEYFDSIIDAISSSYLVNIMYDILAEEEGDTESAIRILH